MVKIENLAIQLWVTRLGCFSPFSQVLICKEQQSPLFLNPILRQNSKHYVPYRL